LTKVKWYEGLGYEKALKRSGGHKCPARPGSGSAGILPALGPPASRRWRYRAL